MIEDDGRDLRQKAVLGFALAVPGRREAERRLCRIRQDIEELTGLETIDFDAAIEVADCSRGRD